MSFNLQALALGESIDPSLAESCNLGPIIGALGLWGAWGLSFIAGQQNWHFVKELSLYYHILSLYYLYIIFIPQKYLYIFFILSLYYLYTEKKKSLYYLYIIFIFSLYYLYTVKIIFKLSLYYLYTETLTKKLFGQFCYTGRENRRKILFYI